MLLYDTSKSWALLTIEGDDDSFLSVSELVTTRLMSRWVDGLGIRTVPRDIVRWWWRVSLVYKSRITLLDASCTSHGASSRSIYRSH